MKRNAFDRFAAKAAEYFGVNENEAADLLDMLEEEGFDWGRNRLGKSHWGERAAELLAELPYYYPDDVSPYELEDEYDEWLEEGEEFEITAEYKERGK